MSVHTFGQNGRIVTAFKNAHHSTAAVNGRHIAHDLGQLGKVLNLQAERADRVGAMTVEASTDENQLWPKASSEFFQLGRERISIRWPRRAERDRQVNSCAQSCSCAGFVGV